MRNSGSCYTGLAINTGVRKGAMLDLKWQQIDFDRNMMNLNPVGRVQPNKRRAIVSVNDVLFAAFCDHHAKLRQEPEKLQGLWVPIFWLLPRGWEAVRVPSSH